jgi:hypothetical protein
MSIQEENTRQLSRLVKQQELTISKLKDLVKSGFHDGGEAGYESHKRWTNSDTKRELEKL